MEQMNTINFYRNFSANETYLNFTAEDIFQEYHRCLLSRIVGCIVITAIFLMALLGNVAVIIVSIWDETIRSQTGNILNLFLAILDTLTAILAMVPTAIAVGFDYWPFGDMLCRLHCGFTYLFTASSSFCSSVISMDRAFAILRPFEYKAKITPKIFFSIIVIILSQNSILMIVPFFIPYIRFDYLEGVCSIHLAEWKSVFGAFVMHGGCVFGCYIPFIICTVSNISILLQVRKSSKVMSETLFSVKSNMGVTSRANVKNFQNLKKSAISMMAIVTVFFICFIPYILMKQVKVIYGIDGSPLFNYITTILVFASSAANPFIYGILRRDYRNAFKKLLRGIREGIREFI